MTAGRLAGLQVAVSLAALAGVAWWCSQQDLPHFPSARSAAGPVLAALALSALVTLLRGERWLRLLRAGRRIDAYALTTVGYMGNNALPARAGDVMKAMLSARCGGLARREAFGSLVAERLLDGAALAAIFAVVVLAAGLPIGLAPRTLALLGAGLATLVALVLVLAPRVRGLVRDLLAPTRDLLGARGALLFALSAAVWVAEGGIYAVLGEAAGLHLGLSDGLYVMALANLAATVPAAPGYVGTWDAAVLLGVRLAGAGSAKAALPYVVLVRFVLFLPITLVGLLFLLGRYGGVATARAALRARTAGAS